MSGRLKMSRSRKDAKIFHSAAIAFLFFVFSSS